MGSGAAARKAVQAESEAGDAESPPQLCGGFPTSQPPATSGDTAVALALGISPSLRQPWLFL